MDKILLKDLRFHGKIGVFESEKRDGQLFIVNIEIQLDLAPAGQKDDLSLSINYADVYQLARELMEESTCDLIETYAESLAKLILHKYNSAQRVIVGVDKPDAPIEGNFGSVGVWIDRDRND